MDTDSQPPRSWEAAQALKDDLFERAKVGEITGEEADAEAIRLGLGSLSHRPGPDEFRPEDETHWTLPMAVAWIAYLDLNDVREWSAPYREACTYWLWRKWQLGFDGAVHEGWFLEQFSKPTFALLGIASAFDRAESEKPMSMTVSEAQAALWVALREGFFAASGIEVATGRRVEIKALDWHELVPIQGRGEVDEVRFGLLGTGYRDVLIPSVALRGFWHPPKVVRLELPELVPPTGNGYMPLFCASQWIATEGGKLSFDPTDVEVWRSAYAVLLAAIASAKVRAIGVKGGQPEPVPAHLFAGIHVDYPYVDASLDLMMSNDLILRSYPYVDDQHWRDGFDDALVDRSRDHWKRLMVEKGDVRSLWPFDESDVLKPVVPRSGVPGRPTSSHLLFAEMTLRSSSGLLESSLAAESRILSSWLAHHHPEMPQAKPKAVQEAVRARYWELRSQK